MLCSLVSSNKPFLIITRYEHTFMFTLSQTMYLVKANLSLLANTLTLVVAQYHLEQNLTASCLFCWTTGLTKREIPTQYYASTKLYTNKCTESQVCNDYTYRWSSVSEVLTGDFRLSIYFHFRVLNTLQNNTSRIFIIVLFIVSFHTRKLTLHFHFAIS